MAPSCLCVLPCDQSRAQGAGLRAQGLLPKAFCHVPCACSRNLPCLISSRLVFERPQNVFLKVYMSLEAVGGTRQANERNSGFRIVSQGRFTLRTDEIIRQYSPHAWPCRPPNVCGCHVEEMQSRSFFPETSDQFQSGCPSPLQ